ncbi:MAG: hypothetical protein KAX49_19340 [Halanaerobiales bacterium]|nr:hypothetical protein [Halanaerobiales bacterium]
METYEEIDLWKYMQIIYRKKVLIFGITFICIIISYVLSSYVIDKKYETETWIKLSPNFLSGQKQIPQEYLEAHFFYPEVVQMSVIDVDDFLQISTLKANLSFHQIGETIRLVYTHISDSPIPSLLSKWLNSTKVKLIQEESSRLQVSLEDKLAIFEQELLRNKQTLEERQRLFSQQSQYIEIEVLPKDHIEPQVMIYKEINPRYQELKKIIEELQISITSLEKQILIFENLLEEYKSVLAKVNQNLESTNNELDDLFSKLSRFSTMYNANLQTNLSLDPFEIISAPYSNPNPISPSVKLNVAIAGFLGLMIGVFLVFFLEYVEEMKGQTQSNTSAK